VDIERSLVAKIISTGQLEDAISKGVRADLFADDECREIFQFLMDHVHRYKSPPSQKAVEMEKPNFEWMHVQDPLDYLIDRFTQLAKRRFANEQVIELAKFCDDPQEAPNLDTHFLEASRSLATLIPSVQVHRFIGDMHKRIEGYEQRKAEGHKFGLPWGFPTLDKWTKGFRRTDYNVVCGFTGTGKTTTLKVVAFNLWVNGKTPLYISLEEEGEDIAAKWDAMAAALDYEKLSQLDLTDDQLKQWKTFRERAMKAPTDIPVIDRIRNCTPHNVFAETIRHAPDLVLVDYVQLMRSGRPMARGSAKHEALQDITQDLKQNARTLGVPILAAAQTNRDGGKQGAELDNIGGSISITQDADVVIGLYSNEEMQEQHTMELRVIKNRRGRLGKFQANWHHETADFREQNAFKRVQDAPEQLGNLEERIRERPPQPPRQTRKKPGT